MLYLRYSIPLFFQCRPDPILLPESFRIPLRRPAVRGLSRTGHPALYGHSVLYDEIVSSGGTESQRSGGIPLSIIRNLFPDTRSFLRYQIIRARPRCTGPSR